MRRSFWAYIGWLFGPFFRWWWAVATGLASVLAFVWTPPAGVQLGRSTILIFAFGGLTLLFLTLAAIVQAWRLFAERYRAFEVVAILKSEEFASGWAFVLRGHLQDSTDVLVEIRRPLDDVEVPFAIVRVSGHTSQGLIQADPIWISAGHLRDLKASRFSASSLIARPHVRFDRVRAALAELDSNEVANVG